MDAYYQIATAIIVFSLFAVLLTDKLRPVLVFSAAAVLLILTQVLTPAEALSGFSSPVIATLALLFVLNVAVEKTGVLNDAVRFIKTDRAFRFEGVLVFVLMLPVALLSGFLNNTPIVLAMVPSVKAWGRRHSVAASRLLIPLSYAAIIGGMWTIIGTSTNLLLNELYFTRTGSGLFFFEPAYIGIPLTFMGILYMTFVGRRLLPSLEEPTTRLERDDYLIEMTIPPGSRLDGMDVTAAGFRGLDGVYLAQIFRDGIDIGLVDRRTILKGSDRLLFAGDVGSAEILARDKHLIPGGGGHETEDRGTVRKRLREVVVKKNSALANKTIKQSNFHARYGAVVLAVHRKGERLTGRIGEIRLRPGDNLILLTGEEDPAVLKGNGPFYVLEKNSRVESLGKSHRRIVYWGFAITILLSALSSMGIISGIGGQKLTLLHFAAVFCLILFITGIIRTEDIKRAIRFDVLIIIGASIGISLALEKAGASEMISSLFQSVSKDGAEMLILALVFLVTNLLTELITNSAAAVLVFPIAMEVAETAGILPGAMVLVVMAAANSSFSTPMGYQTNLIVQSAAGYRFKDFLRVGLPMNVISFLVTMGMVWLLY